MGKQLKEYYVNGYEQTERYGGPEEGGWWYSVLTHRDTALVTPNEEAALSWQRHMRDLQFRSEGHKWHVPVVADNDDGDYDHMVSVRHMRLVYCVDERPGQDFDTHPGEWY